MRAIYYRDESVALVVNSELALFVPELEARGFADPLLRIAAAICNQTSR
jgi:hypothetical protein